MQIFLPSITEVQANFPNVLSKILWSFFPGVPRRWGRPSLDTRTPTSYATVETSLYGKSVKTSDGRYENVNYSVYNVYKTNIGILIVTKFGISTSQNIYQKILKGFSAEL